MRIVSRVVTGLSLFLLLDGLVYLFTGKEYAGGTEILSASVAFGFLAVVIRNAARRAERPEPSEHPEAEEGPLELEHVGPTIWPFAFSLAAVALAVGAVVARWLLVPGAIAFVACAAGWFMDIKRQHADADHADQR
jgi:hypothetical protein